jgi:CubicO group peptidase (beta-lactamase class C family)
MTALPTGPVTGHRDHEYPTFDEPAAHARISGILNRHPAVGLAVGVVRNGRLEFFHGHGLADIATRTPVTEDTVFRIGSITKTLTAIAVMQLCEQGLVDLDAPANDYLRAYTLAPANTAHRPATVRHLLTHTAGLPQLVYPSRAFKPLLGETVPYGRRVPTPAEFYRGRLRLIAEPGTRHTYSNHGFTTLGQIVEDVSGQPLGRYFRERIFAPLGMADTDLGRSDRVQSRLATGYALRSGGPRPVSDCDLVTIGAGAVYSTTRDMASYVTALLGGANEHGSVLKAETLTSMFAPQYQPDPRLPGIGLAFFRRDIGGHLVVEHDGLVPGFSSQMSLAPDDGAGVVAFTNGTRNGMAWLGAEVAGILGRILDVPDPVIRPDVPHHPEIWSDVCGWYSFRGSWRDAQKWFIAGAEVVVRRGQLTLRPLTPVPGLSRGLLLHPDDEKDPYVFRVDLSGLGVGIGTSRVVFSRSSDTGVTALHLDVAFAPLSFDKQPAIRNPRYCVAGGLGAAAAAITASAVREHSRYAPLRARGRALAAAAVGQRHGQSHQGAHQ